MRAGISADHPRPAEGESDMADGTPGTVHYALSIDSEGPASCEEGAREAGAAPAQEAASTSAAAEDAALYKYTPPRGHTGRVGGSSDPGGPKGPRSEQKTFQWRSRLSSVRHRYWSDIEAGWRRDRELEKRERHGDIAFHYPIFWTCWRSQCRLAFRPPRHSR